MIGKLWTNVGSRRRGQRRYRWVWAAAVEEANGRRWADTGIRWHKL